MWTVQKQKIEFTDQQKEILKKANPEIDHDKEYLSYNVVDKNGTIDMDFADKEKAIQRAEFLNTSDDISDFEFAKVIAKNSPVNTYRASVIGTNREERVEKGQWSKLYGGNFKGQPVVFTGVENGNVGLPADIVKVYFSFSDKEYVGVKV